MKKLLDMVWLEAQVQQVLGHTPGTVEESLAGLRKVFQGETRQAFYALARAHNQGKAAALPQPPASPTAAVAVVAQALQVALDKTCAHLKATEPQAIPAAPPVPAQGGAHTLETPTIWARRVVSKLDKEPATLEEARAGLDRVLAELGSGELEAVAWAKLGGERVYIPKPRPDPVELLVYSALLEALDKMAERLQATHPQRVQALRQAAQPCKVHQPERLSSGPKPLRYLKFGGSQVPVYPQDLLPKALQPRFQTPVRVLQLSDGRTLRLQGAPVFRGWQGDPRWWNRPDPKPAEALDWLRGLLASREFVFEREAEEHSWESAHFPQAEPSPARPGDRGLAVYRDSKTGLEWFRTEAYMWE